jgi:hypothetical protein
MSEESRSHDLLAPLRDRAVELDSKRFRADREKIVDRMWLMTPLAVESSTKARRFKQVTAIFAAAAALCVVGWWSVRQHGAVREAQGPATGAQFSLAKQQGSVTRSRDGLETGANARALLRAGNGIEIEVLENSRVSLSELQTGGAQLALRLMNGSVRCLVPRPAADERFVVITNDARIVNHAKVFSVEASDHTTVNVESGEVVVHHSGGETLVSQAASFQTKRSTPAQVLTLETEVQSAPKPQPASTRARSSVKAVRGTLEEETRLLRSALAAERNGRPSEASVSLKTLLSRYPDSPLAPDAKAALARVAGRADSR